MDVGALFGHWTENVIAIFPEAKFIMIEPQADKRKYLGAITHKFKNVSAEFSLVLFEIINWSDIFICPVGSKIVLTISFIAQACFNHLNPSRSKLAG